MEIERLKVLKVEEEREAVKAQQRIRGKQVIVDQIQDRTIQRMKEQEVRDKAFELFAGPLGETKAHDLIDRIWNIEDVANVRDLSPLLMP